MFSKQTSIEIEQLNARVVEAETKLKSEVTRIKKKFQVQITELEFSLDVANKNNIELQKTIKKQSLTLTVSTFKKHFYKPLLASYLPITGNTWLCFTELHDTFRAIKASSGEIVAPFVS
jgi:LPS O-antigen subunit length determinant protein (WzzB/FepE family)